MATRMYARRRPAAFWLDWAPMILLGLTAALCAVWLVGNSIIAGQPRATAVVEAKKPAPTNTAQAPAPPHQPAAY